MHLHCTISIWHWNVMYIWVCVFVCVCVPRLCTRELFRVLVVLICLCSWLQVLWIYFVFCSFSVRLVVHFGSFGLFFCSWFSLTVFYLSLCPHYMETTKCRDIACVSQKRKKERRKMNEMRLIVVVTRNLRQFWRYFTFIL